jgi:hypothetical protein
MTKEQKEAFDKAISEIQRVFKAVSHCHPEPPKTGHEAFGCIHEHWETLWQEVKFCSDRDPFSAIYVAVHALRFLTTEYVEGMPEDIPDEVFTRLFDEYRSACGKHPESPRNRYDGAWVIREEMDEMWEEVRKDSPCAFCEAYHVAVTALRYAAAFGKF